MAIICTACFPKRSVNLILLRLLKQTYCEQKLVQSSPKSLINSRNAPVKYTTNKASTITIAETTGMVNKGAKKYTVHIVFASLTIFLVYFCCLREESDIDEMLKGNFEYENDQMKLLNLKIQLSYCEKNNLPTELLRTKIKEFEDKQMSSPFIK